MSTLHAIKLFLLQLYEVCSVEEVQVVGKGVIFFFSGTALHIQIEFIFIVPLGMPADCCLGPSHLNSDKALQLGQYQLLGIVSVPKHDK